MTPTPRHVASQHRIAIFEVIQRLGGVIRSKNGVPARLIQLHPQPLGQATNLNEILRGMQAEGWLALDEVPGSGKTRKIIEAVLVEMPEHFVAPVAKLRYEKGLHAPDAPPAPPAQPELTNVHPIKPVTAEAPVPPNPEGGGVVPLPAIVQMLETRILFLESALDSEQRTYARWCKQSTRPPKPLRTTAGR